MNVVHRVLRNVRLRTGKFVIHPRKSSICSFFRYDRTFVHELRFFVHRFHIVSLWAFVHTVVYSISLLILMAVLWIFFSNKTNELCLSALCILFFVLEVEEEETLTTFWMFHLKNRHSFHIIMAMLFSPIMRSPHILTIYDAISLLTTEGQIVIFTGRHQTHLNVV